MSLAGQNTDTAVAVHTETVVIYCCIKGLNFRDYNFTYNFEGEIMFWMLRR